MSTLVRLADRVLNRPLLVTPDKVAVIAAVLGKRIGLAEAERPEPEASRFAARQATDEGGNRQPFCMTPDGVAVVTITGSLVNRGAWVGASSGLTSYEGIGAQLAAVRSSTSARALLLDMHTPGGEATGCFECADLVRAVAEVMPVTAVVNGMACSAGYALASAATRIVTTRTGVSGSIGVVMMHADYSRALDAEGITPTLIFAGDHKVDGNPFEPLPDGVRDALKAEVDSFYGLFVDLVAQGRSKLGAEAVRATKARTFIGQAAVDAGLADAVGTFESALAELSATPPRSSGRTPSSRNGSRASMSDPVAHADHVAALATAEASGAKAAQTRIAGILGHAEAKGRSALAEHLAFETNMSVEAAGAMLAKAGKDGGTDTAATTAAADAAALAARAGKSEQTLEDLKGAAQAGAGAPGKVPARIDAAGIYASRRKEMGQG